MNKETEKKSPSIWWTFIFAIVVLIAIIYIAFNIVPQSQCETDGESEVVTGIVSSVTFLGDSNMIDFEDGRRLYLHGSPNARFRLYDIKGLLAIGVNYSFYFHHACVMSDGNTIHYHDGNIIDKIKVIQ